MKSRKHEATFLSSGMAATTMASIRFLGIVPRRLLADVVCRADEKEENPEGPVHPVPAEKEHSASPLLLKGTRGCRSNLRRSSGKVGPDQPSAEDRTTLLALQSFASCATKKDMWHEIALIEAQVALPHKERGPSARRLWS